MSEAELGVLSSNKRYDNQFRPIDYIELVLEPIVDMATTGGIQDPE